MENKIEEKDGQIYINGEIIKIQNIDYSKITYIKQDKDGVCEKYTGE